MSNYITPNVQIVIMDKQDVVATSGPDTLTQWHEDWGDLLGKEWE